LNVGSEVEIDTPVAFHNLTRELIRRSKIHFPHSLVSHHGGIGNAIQIVFPEHVWIFWLFGKSKEVKRKIDDEYFFHLLLHSFTSQNILYDVRALLISFMKILYFSIPFSLYFFHSNTIGEHLGIIPPAFKTLKETHETIASHFPEIKFLPPFFHSSSLSPTFWKDWNQVRDIFDWIGTELNIRQIQDWLSVTISQIHSLPGISRGWGLFHGHLSFKEILVAVYPQLMSYFWNLTSPKLSFWKSLENQRAYCEWFEEKLGFLAPENWYGVNKETVLRYRGSNLIKIGEVGLIVTRIYSEFLWEEWKFRSVPSGFWRSRENVRRYLMWLGEREGVKDIFDWGKVPNSAITRSGGVSLLREFKSVYGIVKFGFSERVWEIMEAFGRSNEIYWDNVKRREYLQDLLSHKIKIPFEFYHLEATRLSPFAQRVFHKLFVHRAIISSFPEFFWESHRFKEVMICLRTLERRFGVKEMVDWYRVSMEQIEGEKMNHIIPNLETLFLLLKSTFPLHEWNLAIFNNRGKKAQQREYSFIIQELLGEGQEVLEDYIHPFSYNEGFKNMEVDIFISHLAIGFEFQGEQHYIEGGPFESLRNVIDRDLDKKSGSHLSGISLIKIPFWWDKEKEKLKEAILTQRPDLKSLIGQKP